MSLLYRRRLMGKRKTVTPGGTVGKTTLYADGTFIINEYEEDRAANIVLHGAVTNEYEPLSYDNPYEFVNTRARPWNSKVSSIKSVEFGSVVKPTSMNIWFAGCTNLTSFDSNNLNTSDVTGIWAIFSGCSALTNIDVSNWDVSNVTTMLMAFYNCSALTNIDVSNWDVSNVTTTSKMFYNCSLLENIDVSSWNPNGITVMDAMFYNCSSLTSLDLSNINGSNIHMVSEAFRNCTELTSLVLFSTNTNYKSNITNNYVFANNGNLASIVINGTNLLALSTPASSASTFIGLKSDCAFYVRADLVNTYKVARHWSTRASYIQAQP